MVKNDEDKLLADATLSDPRWSTVVTRDKSADGRFFYSVRTTGIYCRPSCSSRTAKPENVAFYETRAQAVSAGFRPCKRCKPGGLSLAEEHARVVTKACRIIEAAEELPTLAGLAEELEVSSSHLHRIFKKVLGLTPREYGGAQRARRVRDSLDSKATVTEAIYEAGYNSSGRFYEESNQVLGMTPTQFRSGGAETELYFAIGQCSLGAILVASTKVGVCAILLGDDPEALIQELQEKFSKSRLIGANAGFEQVVATVVGFVEAPQLGLKLPLDVQGTAFQQRVWRALCEIPAGETMSYSEVARKIDAPKSARAVAQACGANKLAVAIPCHRVVAKDGSLSGYRWGVERKRALLEREEKSKK